MFETTYEGPIVTSEIAIAGRTVKVVRPEDPERLLDDPGVMALNRSDDYMPYWAFLWPGAYLLAEAVGRRAWPEGTQAIELGCGLGLAGLAGIGVGLSVEFTDYDEAPLRFVEKSVEANGFRPDRSRTSRLDWRKPEGDRVPVILGADVLYEKRLVPLVCGVIRARLQPGGTAWVAGPYRVATEDLEARLKEQGLTARSESVAATTLEGAPIRGTLHRIQIL